MRLFPPASPSLPRPSLSFKPSNFKPAQSALPALLKETSDAIAEITSFRESNRRSAQFNHLSAISEGIPALGWVTMEPKPAPFVKEMRDAAQFYTNVSGEQQKQSAPVGSRPCNPHCSPAPTPNPTACPEGQP